MIEDPRFKSKILYAPALIGHVNDKNYKIIEQSFTPVIDGNSVSPKLLVIPEDRGTSHENVALRGGENWWINCMIIVLKTFSIIFPFERITNVNNMYPKIRGSVAMVLVLENFTY